MNQIEHKQGALALMVWLSENHPDILARVRGFISTTDFHGFMRGLTGVTTEYFDSHGHACVAYLNALQQKKWKPLCASKTPTLDALSNVAEPQRAPLDWALQKVYDQFPGFITTSSTTEQDKSTGPLSSSPDLQSTRAQVRPDHALAAVFGKRVG